MEILPLEVYAKDSNYAVVKAPGRNFPGCVIQGDSLSILCSTIKDIVVRLQGNNIHDEELLWDVQELNNSLVGRILHYQRVLDVHGVPLPYGNQFSDRDLIELVAGSGGED